MTSYLPRYAAWLLQRALDAFPVVVLMGARQTGKSTLARTEPFLADHLYLTLDDPETHERARLTPRDLVRSAPRLTLDEVQREPDLLVAVKRAVDEERPRRNGRFLLTGSANLLLMQRMSETLAGRATYVNLWPLCRRERLGRGTPGIWSDLLATPFSDWSSVFGSRDEEPADWQAEVRVSGYPTPAVELGDDDARWLWFDGYVRTYLERDLQSPGRGGEPGRFPPAHARREPSSRPRDQPGGRLPRGQSVATSNAVRPRVAWLNSTPIR